MKFHEQMHEDGTRSMLFECPGCECLHVVYVGGTGRPNWSFNESVDKPTVSPSVLVRSAHGRPPVDTAPGVPLVYQRRPHPVPRRLHACACG